MITIAITNQKGGCGKTITAVNLSWALNILGYKVLLIDLDPQAHATFSLNIHTQNFITDMLEHWIQNRKEINPYEFIQQRGENLWVIPSSIGLSAIEHKLNSQDNKLDAVNTLLKKIQGFNFCIIDCPPNLGVLTLNALVSSKYIIVPLGMCDFSLRGTQVLNNIFQMLKEHKGINPEIVYLLTQFDRRSRFSQTFVEKIRSNLSGSLLNTVIRTNITLRESASLGKSIFEYNPKARGAYDYKNLAEEIIALTQKDTKMVELTLSGNYSTVYLVGDFNNWQINEAYRLKKDKNERWKIQIPLKKGIYKYKFVADNRWLHDPQNQNTEEDPFGGKNSVLNVG